MKQRHVFGKMFWRVALRVDRNEKRLNPLASSAQLVERKCYALQVSRADIGAIGESEIDQHQLAAKVLVGTRLAHVIDERERAADRLAIPHQDVHGFRRRAWLSGAGKSEARDQQNSGREPPHAAKVMPQPVVDTSTLLRICARASATKFSPLQCIGMSTSGSSFLISETTCVR